jgi:gamma-glutamyltranspeptidase / glutathione hydrolase / leukotriene-C4 hydrolase
MNQKFKKFLWFGVSLIIIAGIAGTILFFVLQNSDSDSNDDPTNYSGGAIVTNGIECAKIGRNIVESGGSFADVAVATVICEGITCPQSSGLGGGFLATIYIKKSGKTISLNAREVAPKLANSTMFVANPSESVRGGKAVAVPGELHGLWELHQRYGKLQWKDLFIDNIKLAREGHVVSPYLVNIFAESENDLLNEPTLREIYINPATNKTYKLGEKIKRVKLAETLEIIANEGIDVIYGGGRLGLSLVDEIRERGGIITEEDLLDYQARWRTPVSSVMKDKSTLYTMPLPSNGACILFMMNLLREYNLKHDAISYHRIVEAFKFGYAKRSLLGDEPSDEIRELMRNLTDLSYAEEMRKLINDEKTSTDFTYYGAKFAGVEDQGTAHISILMPNGDAIAITATIK